MLKIYKIIDNTNGNIYIGKTKETLNQRLSKHKHDFKRGKKRGKNCSSCIIIKNGDYDIELIEETDDDSRERFWILNTECVNITIPGRTQKEYKQDNKDKGIAYQKKYYKNNKELCIKRAKKHYQDNKPKNIYKNSFGGDPRRNNNLLKIDPNLFLI